MKILFVSLGCDKNLVDSEKMLGMLQEKGYTFTDDEAEADVVVVNTCCFIGDAKEESINTLLQMGDYKAAENRYKNVEGTGFYRHCGKSGLMMPPLALGLWHNFGTNDDYENMKKMCFTAFDNGITHFDIANNYGPVYGSAEENFGKILREELGAYRDELIISTKAGFDMWEGPYGNWGSRKYLIASLDQSLKRLGIPYVDIFYHHRMDPNTPLEETMGALAQIVKSGKALYVGLSNYDGPTMAKAERILDELHVPFVINQNRYSILDRSVENNGLLKQTYASGKGLICFSPLAQGMLTDRYLKDMPADSRAVKDGRFLHEDQVLETRPLLNQLNEIAAGYDMKLSELAIAWLLNKPEVTTVLIGASKPEQIISNLKAAEKQAHTVMTDDELQKIEDTVAAFGRS